jgi:hypothetical protein
MNPRFGRALFTNEVERSRFTSGLESGFIATGCSVGLHIIYNTYTDE